MADYISRETAIKAINDMYEYEFPTASGPLDEFFVKFVPATLRAIPAADVVEVVRCGQCLYKRDTLYCRLRETPAIVSNADFCSYGKRRGE